MTFGKISGHLTGCVAGWEEHRQEEEADWPSEEATTVREEVRQRRCRPRKEERTQLKRQVIHVDELLKTSIRSTMTNNARYVDSIVVKTNQFQDFSSSLLLHRLIEAGAI